MVYRVFDATSDEMRAKWNELQQKGGDVTRFHALSVWTPNVNIFRDPRWGRGQETYGEILILPVGWDVPWCADCRT